MSFSDRKPGLHLALYAALLLLPLAGREASAAGPYRILSPTGAAPHAAVLFVPGCSGFVATNGVNVYDERAAELQAAGYFVVFVDYVARRMQTNCAHVLQAKVNADILEAATWTRDQAGIDASKITVIGWSYGGGGVLAALKSVAVGSPITRAVMYYPVCRGAGSCTTGVIGLMLLGEHIAVPALCNAIAKGVPPDKLRVMTYPTARHGLDMRGLPERTDLSSGSPGYNAEADKAAWSAVRDFLK